MSKKNVSYVKPQEPNFLRKLKEQIGYKEGPTVDTKKETLPIVDDNEEDLTEEQPTVVVLQEGDLTAEEAEKFKEQQEKEKSEAPADLNTRIIFKAPDKSDSSKGTKRSSTEKQIKNKQKKIKPLLSFDDEEGDDI